MVFLLVHVYLATLGRTAAQHVIAMITGYEEIDDPSRDCPRKAGPESSAAAAD